MKRSSNVTNHEQRKISRNNDRSMGRGGLQAANQKSVNAKQHGDPLKHKQDMEHLNESKRQPKEK